MREPSAIHPVDRFVGARLRALRRKAGMTQVALAEALGLTFQQVQKYEKGANRMSASKLFEAAQALGVDIATFFQGYEPPADGAPAPRSRSGGRPKAATATPASRV